MPFKNRVRIAMQLHSAQFPSERSVFRKANGQTKTQSIVVRKTYELEVDFYNEEIHQRLVIALSHDNVRVEAERFLGDISQDGDYSIEWPEGVLHYPAAKANTKVQVTPFDATNANCATCEEVSQLSLENDIATGIYGALQEDTDYNVDTAGNDSICCYPAVFSLVSFNSDYLDSCTIDPATGVVSMHTGTGLTSANGVTLATYRVTCPDGSYDEADITGDIEGTEAGCLAPFITLANGDTSTTALIQWTEPVPGGTYYWELYVGTGPVGSPVQTGTVTDDEIAITGLTPDTDYYFQIRTDCGGGVFSNYVSALFSTQPGAAESCGEYNVCYARPFFSGFLNFSYVDCNGDPQSVPIPNNTCRLVCMLQNSPGDPYSASSASFLSLTYIGLC